MPFTWRKYIKLTGNIFAAPLRRTQEILILTLPVVYLKERDKKQRPPNDHVRIVTSERYNLQEKVLIVEKRQFTKRLQLGDKFTCVQRLIITLTRANAWSHPH